MTEDHRQPDILPHAATKTSGTSSESELSDLLCVFGVWVAGHCPAIPVGPPIAIFVYENQAYEWARNNCNNQYLLKQIEIPFIQFCTSEERKLAEIEGAEMASFFKPLDSAADT